MSRVRLASVLVIAILCVPRLAASAPGDRSPDGLWLEVDRTALGDPLGPLPHEFRAYLLDFDALVGILTGAPAGVPLTTTTSAAVPTISLPVDGSFVPIGVVESPVLSRELAARFPSIKTFAFQGIDDPAISGRASLDTHTFQAFFRPPSDYSRVMPFTTSEGTFYLNFLAHDLAGEDDEHRHDEPRTPPPVGVASPARAAAALPLQLQPLAFQAGATQREFRLAAATTGEYYQARDTGGGDADVVTSIATEVNNANAVFEAEVAVHLTLDQLALFSDPDTDPYMAGSTACQLRDQNVAAINGVVNPNDYDIGYVFGTGGGNGCAWYVVCLNDKARGAGLVNVANPVGSATGLLVHEMGHQLGARHTFSSAAGSCGNPGEFNQPDAYEPGSGSTIMSYRGSCAPDNVDLSSIGGGMYYHTYSFDQIINNITNVVACGNAIPTGNNPPVVDAGADYTIPRSTPFVLTGSATDADNDPLTYTWEQFDVAANQRPIDTDTGEGPIIRSVPPTSSPARTIPALADILSNTHRKGEQLPYTDRQLTFRLTARDNRTGAGGVAYDDMAVTVAGDPFFVTSPNGGEVLAAGCPVPITWTVGGGSVAAQASIDYSTNGGSSFASLIASTANDGSADAVLPCTATAQGRVKASGVGNIFFDVSDGNFSVVQTPPTVHVSAMGGAVDDACTFNVTFTATVEDDCGAHAADVQVQALKQTNNFTVGPVMFNAAQVDARHVSVSGSVLVSDVTDSPAKLGIKVIGADACGASSNDTSVVDIVDTTPPSIDVTVAPDQLWPPNHKLQPVTATVMAADNCPNVSFVLTSVTSNEAVNGVGDGDTSPDIDGAALGTADLQMLLRAERSGTGSGRIYTIKYTATDASNNATSASAIVVVPHSKKP